MRQARCERMGVEVLTRRRGHRLRCRRRRRTATGGSTPATVVWAAGRRRVARGALARRARRDRAGRVIVGPDLSVPGRPEVFAIGDTAASGRGGRPVPGIAPAAKQMGRYVGRLIAARVAGEAAPRALRLSPPGDLATIGRSAAVVRLDRIRLTGFIGWLFWGVAHVYFLIGLRNRLASP